MSTQSPHPPTPKGPRNNNNYNYNNNNNNTNRRPPKKNHTPHAQKMNLLNTPPSSPPRNMSPAGATTDSSIANTQSKKKPPRSAKKPTDNINRSSPAPNGQNGHRHTSSQSNMTPQPKDSAYAGPTFHASPAPSALPIPSFFSKSLPESDLATTVETDSDTADMDGDLETTPSKPRARPPQPPPQPVADEPQATPLDFLFKAAVKMRESNQMTSPEASSRMRSPQTDPKYLHSNSSGGVFPFEMDHSEQSRASPIGPSFAPSYQDRMNALRSSSSNSPVRSPGAEEQRRMKTQELKDLLLNPRPQKPSSVSPPQQPPYPAYYGTGAHGNPSIPHYATPTRTHSGPAVPLSHGHSPAQLHQMPNNASRPSSHHTYHHQAQVPTQVRNTESPLRREVPTNYNVPSPGPYGYPYARQGHVQPAVPPANYISPQPQYTTPAFNMHAQSPSPSKPHDTKQMEDQLRQILKLDATTGMQSSFA